MSNIYNDEMLKNSKKQSDVDNYNLIQGFKNDYITAEKAGDTEGMKRANQNAEAVRATYGYSGGEAGNNYVNLNSVDNGNNSNSFFDTIITDALNSGEYFLCFCPFLLIKICTSKSV